MNKTIILFIIAVLTSISWVFAEELHIDNDGNFRIELAPVSSTNNNFLTISVWGTKWNVFMDEGSKVTGADELDLNYTNIKTGHLLNIEGKYNTQFKYIDVKTVMDMSVGTPKPKPVAAIGLSMLSPQPVSPPPAASPPASLPEKTASVVEAKTVTSITKYLKLYMSGPEVKFLQEYLAKNGFLSPDNATGYFGRVTRGAVQAFQKSKGLESLGAVGPQTRAIINGLPIPAAAIINPPVSSQAPAVTPLNTTAVVSEKKLTLFLKITYRGGEVKILQEFLVSQGLVTADNVTGVFGPATESAVKAFQKSRGIEETGMIGPETRAAINGLINSR
ncbi:MAG: hypothetical protein A3G49_04670 [Candidatus Sungbacteria bacterium RIFCSPLOWO2_12_FULL_41_11]|uniref:Peptidoglycan binding-like domain-containing protein n=1 Tax=Candidatus Sungbacteria bacterium RIFCSPLOWO2_12_FULL_41_11 TaxID=1802286 RepID=A0A1G2LNE5_9BACT|nr:MAG: NLP/P60 protein [Parcubacteria group bacterium GW2011_GWA2_42_14]OHA13125.1 MAG: hypothetical protein A3G49_04670 [Candidatus Sungbacteria bacterium RIFCSPLOWO2_12_FULL_41_11]